MEFLRKTTLDKALEKQLTVIYSEDKEIVMKWRRVFLQKIKNLQKDEGAENLFLLIDFQDRFHPDFAHTYKAMKYTPEDFAYLFNMADNPKFVWEQFSMASNDFPSDIASLIYHDNPGLAQKLWVPYAMGIWNPENPQYAEDMTQEEKQAFERLFFPLIEQRRAHVGRFMKWGLDFNKLAKSTSKVAEFFKGIRDRDFLQRELQIPWMTQYNTGVNERIKEMLEEENDGNVPIQDEIYRIPCMLYALESQVDEETYKILYDSKKILARGSKISFVKKILKDRGYYITLYTIRKDDPTRLNSKVDKHRETDKEVKLMFWEDHWMRYLTVNYGGKATPFIKILALMKEEGLLYPYNIYELAKEFQCYSFDSMLGWNTEQVQELVKKSLPNNYEFTEQDWDVPEYKENTEVPPVIVFADFECTTNEKYHIPYLICAKAYLYTDKGFVPEYEIPIENVGNNLLIGRTDEDNMASYWGRECGTSFLKSLCRTIHITKGERSSKPKARIYFFNLKYDITFILPHLKKIDKVQKDGRLYSCKGFFCYEDKEVCFEFWDAYPLFQSTLAKAGNDYLTAEEKKTIKKEAYPYSIYTYQFFGDTLKTGIISGSNLAEITAFESDPNYEAFKQTVEDSLEEDTHYTVGDTEHISYHSKLALKDVDIVRSTEVFETEEGIEEHNTEITRESFYVDWVEYAEFYCKQDVRILATIMNNMRKLVKAEGLEGIHGEVPFSLDLVHYRTASSLSYNYFLRTVIFKKDNDGWISRHPIYLPKGLLRYLIQLTVRGGRVMIRDNEKQYYDAILAANYIQDYDAVSLYPSAMSKLWISEGIPKLLKGLYNEADFKKWFCDPEDDDNKEKKPYTDGCIHLTRLYTRKYRHFPQLCIKDKKTGLNDYKNYNGPVDTWVNAIDLYNLIDFQDAVFEWDMAIVWPGPRRFEIRDSITKLFEFRKANHGKGVEHPIQNVAKTMMNSIYGKSVLKASDRKKIDIDMYKKRYNKNTGMYETVNNWHEFFRANLYRIHSFEVTEGDHVTAEIYCRDMSHSFNIFGSNVLAMARRMIGRVMALAEDIEEEHPELSPGLFYTDTDSMHIRQDLLQLLVPAFEKKYGWNIMGKDLCQFHIDFDPPKNFKEGEFVKGANESYFIAKKIYADRLVGSEGSVGYHLRMKGVPTSCVKYEDYEKIFKDNIVEFDLLANGKTSFFYEGGRVGCRLKMTRKIGTKEAKRRQREEEIEAKQAKKAKKSPVIVQNQEDIETEDEDATQVLPPSAQEIPFDDTILLDIE